MFRISVDVGGTFTDVVVADESGALTLGKALTTPHRSYEGFRNALANAADILSVDVNHILHNANVLIYGTTRATNAIVEGKVAKTAFLTTEGFPNILAYKQGGKQNPFQIDVENPPAYVPRKYTFEIRERINAEGGVETELDEDHARAVIDQLGRIGIESIGVCLLWSVANNAHERRLGELIEEGLPGVPYTLSCDLNPVIREYPRASSTCIDASLKPLMQKHLRDLQDDLNEAGFKGELLISASTGGVVHAEEAIARPIFMVKSGPAMAPLAGIAYSGAEDLGDDILICDTGGTTFDVSLVRAGLIKYSRETWLLGKWVGHNLGMSTVDIRSIGAGGGSIAWVDPGGLLRVGPQSAGSKPGPACYGLGGDEPTVTDAAVVLGYIDPEFFLGGRMKLDLPAAKAAIQKVADKINISVDEAAFGIIRIANEQMIKAIQEITINDGINPRESIIVAGGGAAGLNILPIAESLGCKKILIPKTAGGLSACGAQYSDIVTEFGVSQYANTASFDKEAVNGALDQLVRQANDFAAELKDKGVTNHKTEIFVEARYVGQQWELEIPCPVAAFDTDQDIDTLTNSFHETHERLYSVKEDHGVVECINWKLRLTARLEKPAPVFIAEQDAYAPTAERSAEAFFGGNDSQTTPVYLGADLKPGAHVQGPCIIEEPTTTVVVYPGMTATMTSAGNYVLDTGV